MNFSKKVLAILAVPILLVSVALFVKLNTNNVMVINTCNEHSYSDAKIIKSSTGPNTNIGFNINLRSSNSEIQSFKFLCLFESNSGKSVCENKDDEMMSKVIRKVYLDPPSVNPYSFRVNPPALNGQIGVPKIIDELLGGKQNGFYIESGGYDGEALSNSLFFELKRNFTGLLVEPNVFNYKKLLEVNRKAYSVNACYSTTGLPTLVDFVNARALGAIKEIDQEMKLMESLPKQVQKDNLQGESKALCLSFYSILLAVGNPVVDYPSLDIEGAELPVLKTIPWDKVDIKVLSIECGQIERCNNIDIFMKSVGYYAAHHIPSEARPQDIIFVKK